MVYAGIGILAGAGGILYVKFFYGIQSLFKKLKVSKYFRPAIGAAIVGVIAIFFPEVLGLGYGWVQQIFLDNLVLLPLWILIVLFFMKIIATSFTIGSGGSGGVFAPGIVTGAFMGAAIGIVIHPFFPYLNVTEITIVTMIAFFGGISKAPISVMIMGTEMTGGFALFLPLMLSTVISYFVSGSKYSIYSAQVLNRSQSPAHKLEYETPVMDQISVRDAMNREYPYVEENDPLREGLEKLRSTKTKMIVVQSGSILQGALSIEHIKQDSNISVLKVKDVMNPNPITIGDNANIHEALDLLTRSADGKLIVMNHEKNGQVLGTITLSEIADAYNREIRKIKMEMAEQ